MVRVLFEGQDYGGSSEVRVLRKYHCKSGVPCGHLLFLLYAAGLSDFIEVSENIKLQIYADDIKVFIYYK